MAPVGRRLRLPALSRWHVTTQDRIFFHLARIWGTTAPRIMVDLGSHASHGHFTNLSDTLLWLDTFHARGSVVVGVDAFEDFVRNGDHRTRLPPLLSLMCLSHSLFSASLSQSPSSLNASQALDLQRRFDTKAPYASMNVTKRSLALAVSDRDDELIDFSGPARVHATCCAGVWCGYARLEKERGADHLCQITRMRLGILPAASWLPPSSYTDEDFRWLVNRSAVLAGTTRRSRRRISYFTHRPFRVRTVRLETLWRSLASLGDHADTIAPRLARSLTAESAAASIRPPPRIDFLKVDIDTSWTRLGGLEELLKARGFTVMTIEVDGSWGGIDARAVDGRLERLSAVDGLAHLARLHGFDTYLKVPCKARAGSGSLEQGKWAWNWKRRKYAPAPSTSGEYSAWLFPLASGRSPFMPSGYVSRGSNGVQDLLLLDARAPELADLPALVAADCLEPPSLQSPQRL